MRTTLLTAQKMANAMVAEAEEKKAQLLKDAESTVLEQVNAIRQSIVQEQARLAAAQSATAAFVSQVREACTRQLDALDELPHLNVPAPSTESAPDPVESAAEEIDLSLIHIFLLILYCEVGVSAPQGTAPGGVCLWTHLFQTNYSKMAAYLLPPVFLPAVQTVLSGRWTENWLCLPLSTGRGFPDAQ